MCRYTQQSHPNVFFDLYFSRFPREDILTMLGLFFIFFYSDIV